MKILVGGCSFSAGYGLPAGINDPSAWPNLLAKKLDADLVNVSVPGYDNQGIFLNILRECTSTSYDVILLQLTEISRINFSPNIHGIVNFGTMANNLKGWDPWFSPKEFKEFVRLGIRLNGNFEHWKRLSSILLICQNLIEQGYNIKLVNGLLNWDENFFLKERSDFSDLILDPSTLPDEDIKIGLDAINKTKTQIDLTHWINPFQSFANLAVDVASPTDSHPGIKSQQIYSDLIFNFLNHQEGVV